MNDYYEYDESFDDYEEDDDLGEGFDEFLLTGEEDDLDEDIAMELGEEFSGESGDAAEGRRSRRRAAKRRAAASRAARGRNVAAAKSNKSFRARLTKNPVTQPQLQATSARLDRKISVNAQGIKKVNARVNALKVKHARDVVALKGRMDRHTAAIRKEQATRKQADEKLSKDLQMAMLLPMMMKPTPPLPIDVSKNVTLGGTGGIEIPKGTKLATASDSDDSMSMMLPLMMMSGGEGGDNNMMMLALMMGMGKDK